MWRQKSLFLLVSKTSQILSRGGRCYYFSKSTTGSPRALSRSILLYYTCQKSGHLDLLKQISNRFLRAQKYIRVPLTVQVGGINPTCTSRHEWGYPELIRKDHTFATGEVLDQHSFIAEGTCCFIPVFSPGVHMHKCHVCSPDGLGLGSRSRYWN